MRSLALGLARFVVAEPQSAGKPYRIGVLGIKSRSSAALNIDAVRPALRELGDVDGRSIADLPVE